MKPGPRVTCTVGACCGVTSCVCPQMLGGLCQSLLVRVGAADAGVAYHGLLTTSSACALTTTLLILCYVLSRHTQQLVQQSIFVSYIHRACHHPICTYTISVHIYTVIRAKQSLRLYIANNEQSTAYYILS